MTTLAKDRVMDDLKAGRWSMIWSMIDGVLKEETDN
jgi:hypothetical protein